MERMRIDTDELLRDLLDFMNRWQKWDSPAEFVTIKDLERIIHKHWGEIA